MELRLILYIVGIAVIAFELGIFLGMYLTERMYKPIIANADDVMEKALAVIKQLRGQ